MREGHASILGIVLVSLVLGAANVQADHLATHVSGSVGANTDGGGVSVDGDVDVSVDGEHDDDPNQTAANDTGTGLIDVGADLDLDIGTTVAVPPELILAQIAADHSFRAEAALAMHGGPLIGHLTREGEHVNGTWVSFTIEQALLSDRAHGAQDLVIKRFDRNMFETIGFANGATGDVETDEAHVTFTSGPARFRIHDTHTAMTRIEASEDLSVRLMLPMDVDVEPLVLDRPQRVFRLSYHDGAIAHVIGTRTTYDHETRTFTVEGDAYARLFTVTTPHKPHRPAAPDDRDRSGAALTLSGSLELHAELEAQLEASIALAGVAVEIHADRDRQRPIILEMGHVQVHRVEVSAQGDSYASVRVEAPDDAAGAVILVRMDAEDLGGLTVGQVASELAVSVDGASVSAAADLNDALAWDNDDGPEYLMLVSEARVDVLVSLPHFSPHTIEVHRAETQAAASAEEGRFDLPLPWAALLGAMALAALGARRRNA